MGKRNTNRNSGSNLSATYERKDIAVSLVLGMVIFAVVCLSSASTVKTAAVLLSFSLVAGAFVCFGRLRGRIGLPILALCLFATMGGISTLYAVAGKFALYEFLKVLCALSMALLLTALAPGRGERPMRWIGTILETACAAAALVSIDLLSTRILSGAFQSAMSLLTPDYSELAGVEAGVRMTSIFTNPNIFAGCAGIGVLLSLGLALSSAGGERMMHCALLYVNALGFLLAFSMGASGAIACAFAVYLLLVDKTRRAESLVLMLETLVLTVAAAGVVSLTSFGTWEGINVIPLLCTAGGAAALCALDRFAGSRLTGLKVFGGRAALFTVLALICAVAVYAVAAWNWTGSAKLSPGGWLRRAAYPQAGSYTLQLDAQGPVDVSIESQNRQETMMHTSTILYSGAAADAVFTVPEDSLVVYFNFNAPEGAQLDRAQCAGEAGSVKIPLGYRLLPGFIANRIQGLFANENAIQRFVFFDDGMKLFRRSPVIGLGMGTYENAIKSVQSFYYETKYAHNHYIQTLLETGIIGLVLFVGVFAVSAVCLYRTRKKEDATPLLPALGAALTFMAIHGAVEVVFSSYPYLPLAFGVFALINLGCGDCFRLDKRFQIASLVGASLLVGAYGVLTAMNMRALQIVTSEQTFQSLEVAAKLDRFEWADYLLTYVDSSTGPEADDEVRQKAEVYAARLGKVESNSVSFFLADYYFRTGKTDEAFAMLEKYVNYVSSDSAAWNNVFHMLEQYGQDTEGFTAGVLRLVELLDHWTAENMGEISLDEAAQGFVARYAA